MSCAIWERLPILGRLLVTASLALVTAALAMVYTSVRIDAADAGAQLRSELAAELGTLPPALAELLVLGDYATLKQTLDQHVQRANVARIAYRDASGATVESHGAPVPSLAPAWFAAWLGLGAQRGEVPAVVGMRRYGTLEATITAQNAINGAWARLVRYLAILALAVALDFLGIWLVLRASLKPLRALDAASLALAEGDLSVRVPVAGSPELRHSTAAFNRMAEALERRENEIRELNATLERRVEQRTAQLSAAVQELEAFSYSVAHDLRAPLRSLDGFAQLLITDHESAIDLTGRDYLRRIRRAAQRMGRLIDDLLDLSRLMRTEMRPAPVDLGALAREVLADLRSAEPERQVTFSCAPGIMAWGDPVLLRVIVQNLLGNAWKFTARVPGARIELGMLPRGEGAPTYFVRDNGAGFDMTFAGKLFRPFQRLHADEEFAGSGVGLALVARAVGRHDGRVWAESQPGAGAAFFFTLPEPAAPA